MLPLFDAARNGHTEIVALLLEYRADVNLADSVSCHSACPLQAQEVHGAGAAPDERAAAGAVAFREAAPKQAALAPNVQTCAVHGRGSVLHLERSTPCWSGQDAAMAQLVFPCTFRAFLEEVVPQDLSPPQLLM